MTIRTRQAHPYSEYVPKYYNAQRAECFNTCQWIACQQRTSFVIKKGKAVMRNLVSSLFEHQTIETTVGRAKEAQVMAEKMITLAKTKNVHNVRRAMAVLQDKELVQKLFDEIGPYYADRPGGYTRVVKLSKPRLGDNATRAYLGFVRVDEQAEAVVAEDTEE